MSNTDNHIPKNILVTGGMGFLGRNLVKLLSESVDRIYVVDNLSTGRFDNSLNIAGFAQADVEQCSALQFEEWGFPRFDQVYNLACPASPPAYQQDMVSTLRTNYVGVDALLRYCAVAGTRFLQASTSEVYGDPECDVQSESYWGNTNPYGVRSCYDEGKRVAESLCFAYNTQRGVDTRIVRIFNTYGPGMQPDDGRVVSNFIVQALQGKDLTVYGTGDQTRSFCYVDDLVSGIVKLMNCTDESKSNPVNLGNPREFTMLQLAAVVLEATGSKSRIVFQPLPGDDPKQRKPDISRASVLLNWEPLTELIPGIKKTVDYFKGII